MFGYGEQFWVGQGVEIVNALGQVTVTSEIQRTHPGDLGMAWIAEQIENAIGPLGIEVEFDAAAEAGTEV